MKNGNLKVIAYLAAFIFYISAIWAIVEFIIYLVKDKEFNWWSLGICIAAFAIMVITSFVGAVKDEAKRVKDFKKMKEEVKKDKVSYKERLEAMVKKQKEEIK